MDHVINDIGLLVIVAIVVAMVARRARVPYAVGLVVTGAVLAAAGLAPAITLSREFIYVVLLPPLVFDAALYIDWADLRRDGAVIGLFATLGVVIAAAITATGMHYAAGWPVATAACFGALIAATDPVSVIATFKESGVKGRLRLLVEAESLFNDATAAILFGLAVTFASGEANSALHIVSSLVRGVAGGVTAGALVAGIALLLAWRTTDHLVEVTITTVAAYGAFLAAERFHASGVLASLTAGLIVGNVGKRGPMSPEGRVAIRAFWEYAAFAANSVIFLLIGVQVEHAHIPSLVLPSAVAMGLVLVSRAASIYPLSALLTRTRLRISMRHQHVLFWGGLRGALALALALGLPETLPGRAAVVTVTFAVVAFSIIGQGLTVPPLLRHLGETGVPGGGAEH